MGYGLIVQMGLVLVIASCAFALFRGGSAERWGSLLIIADYVAADVAMLLDWPRFPVTAVFVLDFILAVALLIVAIRFSSLWLGAAMMLQSIALCSYGLAATGDGLHGVGYIRLNNILSFTMYGCVIAGTIASWRKRIRLRRGEGGSAMAGTVLA